MRIITSKGTFTAPEKIVGIFIEALDKAAKYERGEGHIYDCDLYLKFREEVMAYVEKS